MGDSLSYLDNLLTHAINLSVAFLSEKKKNILLASELKSPSVKSNLNGLYTFLTYFSILD